MNVRTLSLSAWSDVLPNSGFEVFHVPEALSVLAEHTDGNELRLYAGFKGDQPIAVVPLFIKNGPLGTTVVSSPPPGMHVPHLGPIIMPTSPKQRKCEQVNQTFIDEVFDEIGIGSRTFLFMLSSPQYSDPRPFHWANQAVNVSFTYNLPVDGASPDEVLKTFSKSRRREVRSGRDLDVRIELGGIDEARAIYDQTKNRFSEQNEYFGLTWPFVEDLVTALDNRARVYVATTPDGKFLGGIIALYSNDSASFWLGGVRSTYENISLNTLLHWAIIRDIAVDPDLASITQYDMVGAGKYRLSKYKSKFNPRLVPYYVIESPGTKMKAAKAAYNVMESVRSRAHSISSLLG